MSALLAIDLGLKCGFAYFDERGRLERYGSTNFGNRSRFKRGAYRLVRDPDGLDYIVVEGDRNLGEVFEKLADKYEFGFQNVAPATWRKELLLPRQRRSGTDAKEAADDYARRVIDWSDLPGPTSLRHDAAEAILIGLWAAMDVGLLRHDDLPDG